MLQNSYILQGKYMNNIIINKIYNIDRRACFWNFIVIRNSLGNASVPD